MGMVYWVLTALMAVGALAFWHKMKLWSVVIVGFNVLFASLFSIGLFEMVANLLDGFLSVTMFYNDLIAFFVIFVFVLALLMVITSKISKIDLFFQPNTDKIGKWICVLLVVVGFAGVPTFVFYEIMPEKPKNDAKVPTMATIDLMSKGSLSPLVGGAQWDTSKFVQEQKKRDAAVYTQTVDQGMSGWKFDGDSPNAR